MARGETFPCGWIAIDIDANERRSMGIYKALIVFAAPVMVFVLASPSCAQSASTSVRGTISDSKGAVISQAQVTIANPSTGFSRTVMTNDQGFYQFLEIPPSL